MKVFNIHKRKINKSFENIAIIMAILSINEDKVWPHESLSAMKFDGGIKVGAKNGHDPINYKSKKNKLIEMSEILLKSSYNI